MVYDEINRENKKRVLVIGDILRDEYRFVKNRGKSQESNIDKWEFRNRSIRPGGAANVALNVASLSNCEVYLAGTSVVDINSFIVGVDMSYIARFYSTPTKKRYVNCDNNEILFREDVKDFCARYPYYIDYSKFDFVVFSDYCKGTIESSILNESLFDTFVIVDSKRKDLSLYEKYACNVLNINYKEYESLGSDYILYSNFDYIVVTLGSDGSILYYNNVESNDVNDSNFIVKRYEENKIHLRTDKVNEVDVTGCGDVHTAGMVAALSRDHDNIEDSVRYANKVATIAVQEFGTTVVNKWEFLKK